MTKTGTFPNLVGCELCRTETKGLLLTLQIFKLYFIQYLTWTVNNFRTEKYLRGYVKEIKHGTVLYYIRIAHMYLSCILFQAE